VIKCRITALIILLLFFIIQAVYASDHFKIEPDLINFGFVPIETGVIKQVTIKNNTDSTITDLSITIPDSLLSYYKCESLPNTIEHQDSITIHISFCCHEMFVTCEGLIYIEYMIGVNSFTDIIEVHGEPALKRGWNWISFPKLNRRSNQGTEISAILKPLKPFARIVLCKGGVMESIENTWTHMGLFYYDDTAFIKLRMLGGNENVYPFELKEDSLSLIPADTALDLNKGYNWIGYWLPESQKLRTAFGTHWDKVHAIKAEGWFYINQKFYANDYSIIFNLPANQDRLLHYGRGYVVIMKEPVKGFYWTNTTENRTQELLCKKSSYFAYQEEANYEVVDVINIPENAEELGAFNADGVCIGAGIVNESHAAQILVYPCDTKIDTEDIFFKLKYYDETDLHLIEYLLFDNSDKKFVDKKLHVNTQVYNIIKMCNG